MIRWSILLLLLGRAAVAETGYDAWLRYPPVPEPFRLPATVVVRGHSPVLQAAQAELLRGVQGMFGKTLRSATELPIESAILLETNLSLPSDLVEDGYVIRWNTMQGHSVLAITALNDRGVLYGTFALLRKLALHQNIAGLYEKQNPAAPIRWTNEWNNLDGSIERGYAGRSIFFDNNNVMQDLTRASDYARLLASIGINGCAVNNVNANPRMIATDFLPQVARLADAFRPWGVRLVLSIDFSSPKILGGLDTFDPVDPRVAAWWKAKADEIYRVIPDLGGFVLKADSEGRLGPSAYGRTHADAANVVARALKPHSGVVLYRGFVYDHHMDWRNPKNDRARAAFDNFQPLDGQFDSNVLIQIKHGPIDFQAREPISPLFFALKKTNEAIELQVTQEYTGQQRHLCFLVPMWKQVLDSNVKGRLKGFVAVSNVGLDRNWLGADLAMANLYGFGRLAWNPDLTSRQIAEEWTRLTFNNQQQVVDTIVGLQLESWHIYESYTGPLGAGTFTDIIHVHYGPGIESSERNGWGQWHRADEKGIGMDRTVATGTSFIGQYEPALASLYESLARCPDELLLFMHHVPYTHVLHSGKTVIQHIYDSHYVGAAAAQTFPQRWQTLRGKMDDDRFQAVLARLNYQAGHAIVWRDAICNWFFAKSGIADTEGRVGHHPGRIEAESMTLHGYIVEPVTPWETASQGKGIACTTACSATFAYQGKAGWFNIATQYFDQNNGISHFKLFIGNQMVDTWAADADLPSNSPNGHTSTRRLTRGIALRPNDSIRIEAVAHEGERAMLDYVEIVGQTHSSATP